MLSLKFLFFSLFSASVLKRFLGTPGTKTNNQKLSSSSLSRLALCWRTPSVLIQSVYNSALAFTSCRRSARGESLRSSQEFSEHAFFPGYACGFLNSPVYTGTFECSNFSMEFSPSIFVPVFKVVYCIAQPLS